MVQNREPFCLADRRVIFSQFKISTRGDFQISVPAVFRKTSLSRSMKPLHGGKRVQCAQGFGEGLLPGWLQVTVPLLFMRKAALWPFNEMVFTVGSELSADNRLSCVIC